MNNPSKVLGYHEAIGKFSPKRHPECFNRGVQSRNSSGFPLKACGNDGLSQSYQPPTQQAATETEAKEKTSSTRDAAQPALHCFHFGHEPTKFFFLFVFLA
jgi:hypothetical protein